MKDLRELLDETINHYRNLAGWNYRLAYICTVLAIVLSSFSGLAVARNWFSAHAGVTAVLASLPAFFVALNSTMKFERRSRWHWKKTHTLEAIRNKLAYENVPPAEVSKLFGEAELAMEQDWPELGQVDAARSGGKSEAARPPG